MLNKSPTYKIRQVIEITGASEFLIRAWELRYNALNPVRTQTGRRLYRERDILKIRALLTLTNLGHRISDIAQKSLTELDLMLLMNEMPISAPKNDFRVEEILNAAKAFKWDEVHVLISAHAKRNSQLNWIEKIVVPLLSALGEQVNTGQLSIAQEHILSAIIKDYLASSTKFKSSNKTRLRFVFAAPEGDYHDIGIMVASRIANCLGTNTLFLGPHMPKNELVAVCIRYRATHLVLSSTTDSQNGSKDDYISYVSYLDRNLDSKVTLWLAGPHAQKYKLALKRPFKIVDSLESFKSEVSKCLN